MASNPRIDDLRKRLEKEPASRLFAQLAEELRKDGEFEEAIRIARAGLARHPSYPSARMTLGRALFDTGDMAAAREELQTVLNGAPDNILASRLLAECLEGLGDLEAALGRYRATLALSPGDKPISARVRDLEGKLQAAPAAAAWTKAPETPIPLATVDEPMELETSQERPAPGPEGAPIPLVETSAEFELETAYDAPGTQWRTGQTPAVAPTPGAPGADTPPVMHDATIGERTLVDEPAPTIDVRQSPAPPEVRQPPPAVAAPAALEPEPSFEYAFDTPASVPAPPAAPEPPAPAPPAPEAMPPLPEPVAVAAPEPLATPEPAVAAAPPSPPPVVVAPVPPPAPAVRETPAPAAPVPAPAAIDGELASPTLAELYFNQGFPEKAIEVYRRLLGLEPANARARARLDELLALVAAPAAPALPATGAGAAPTFAGEPPAARGSEEARAARRQALERTIERLESLRAALQKGPR